MLSLRPKRLFSLLMAPIDYAKRLKLWFRVGDLDLPGRRNKYTSSRVDEEGGAQKCPCGNADDSRVHTVGKRELYKEERNVLEEEMRKTDRLVMEKLGTLHSSSEKTIAILGNR